MFRPFPSLFLARTISLARNKLTNQRRFHCFNHKPIRADFLAQFPRALLAVRHAQKRRALGSRMNRGLRIQRCGNSHRAFTDSFASSSINFGFALKLLRIKDQRYTVLVKCQFVCNRVLSVLTSMPFDGTSSGRKCYGAGRRRLSFGSFQKGLENRERTEK